VRTPTTTARVKAATLALVVVFEGIAVALFVVHRHHEVARYLGLAGLLVVLASGRALQWARQRDAGPGPSGDVGPVE
jgi:hypothetical protein